MQIESESRDNTRCQIEDSDSPYRDTCHDLKNVVVTAVAPGKDITWSITIIPTTLSFQMTTLRLDARHRAKNGAASRSWTLGQGRILLETDVVTEYAELSVGMSGLDQSCERSVQNVSRDRLNKIQYSDHVKSQYSVILLHISRSWIYFINQKLHRMIQTNHSFFDECWIESAHTSSSDSSDSVERCDQIETIIRL